MPFEAQGRPALQEHHGGWWAVPSMCAGHDMLLGVNTSVTRVTGHPLHLRSGLLCGGSRTGARRATGQPCPLRAASPAAAYFLLTD